ncbi:family 43 glycosylhydrolase [Sphingobacterium sp. E70]|uniref:family 43 glycosylhydrolase n=1 Tax=Sphingobacterium sp. E70 TaxID=2853439 RepID=UPI00211CF200|nr:family 43 glycosylhydrolase [Sphingobacterium sp. E70]
MTSHWGKPKDIPLALKRNPVLNGFYADPDILYAHKTQKYYIYPTSDGFDGWGGFYFKTFSSTDLIHWKDEGVILDLKKEVAWGPRHAWAPTIIEKKSKATIHITTILRRRRKSVSP